MKDSRTQFRKMDSVRFSREEKTVVDPIFRIAETATKTVERKAFRKLMVFAKRYADECDGFLF